MKKKTQLQKEYSAFKKLSKDDKDLLNEAQHYTQIKWIKTEPNYWNYLKMYLHIVPSKSNEEFSEYNFFIEGLMGTMNVIIEGDFITLWIWVEEGEEGANEILYEKIFKKAFFHQEGLFNALNPGNGGTWNELTKNIASIIIYG